MALEFKNMWQGVRKAIEAMEAAGLVEQAEASKRMVAALSEVSLLIKINCDLIAT